MDASSRRSKAAFTAEPDNVFTTADLCERVYRLNYDDIEKRHRIAVVRAAKKMPGLDYFSAKISAGSWCSLIR